VLDAGHKITQETRHWHEDTGVTTAGREKSDAEDYRYFPEPDLVPVAPSAETVEALRATLPEPPAERRARLQSDWGYSDLEMRDVVNAGALELIEETVTAGATPAAARKWWLGELARRANAEGKGVEDFGVTPAHVAELDQLVKSGRLNDSLARQVLDGVIAGEGTPTEVADARGLELVQDDSALEGAVDKVIEANPDVAQKIRDGKVQAAGALIGQVMKEMKGQADAGKARELILAKLT
jgi:aspartyl-tRNA(Asn)/glutamyl-tRNA(Gln) amidotransferase subunit B